MDERLVIPNSLQAAVNNRLHYYHHGKSSMYDAAKDIWYPYMFRSLATIAGNCQECSLAGKNLKSMCSKNDIGKKPEPKEPNESVQLDFWGPINYLKESKKYVLVAVDRFSCWPLAMVCNSNRSDKIIKFLKAYIIAAYEFRVKFELTKEQTLCPRRFGPSVINKELRFSSRQLTITGQQDVWQHQESSTYVCAGG